MNHLITAITSTVILGIVSGAPLLTCDKIKHVNQDKDNQDRYLDQWSLEMNAFNLHDNSVKSQLELLENVGLQGILSKQALFLVSFHNTHCLLLQHG